jgi:hypothetical protein
MEDLCSLGETNVGFWYRVAPPREPLNIRMGIRTYNKKQYENIRMDGFFNSNYMLSGLLIIN